MTSAWAARPVCWQHYLIFPRVSMRRLFSGERADAIVSLMFGGAAFFCTRAFRNAAVRRASLTVQRGVLTKIWSVRAPGAGLSASVADRYQTSVRWAQINR